MKKTVSILCAILSAACIGAFAACDGDEAPEGLDSAGKVTEAEWNTAFSAASFDNVRFYTDAKGYDEIFGKYDHIEISYDGDKREIEYYRGCLGWGEYITKEDGKYYTYIFTFEADIKPGIFIKSEADAAAWEKWSMGTGVCEWLWQAADYSQAVWNDTEKGYVVTAEGESVVIKFKDKKLVAFYKTDSDAKDNDAKFSYYGKTPVTLPSPPYMEERTK